VRDKRILIHECRCNERLKDKTEGSIRLAHSGLCGGLEHLMIETRLRHERLESVIFSEVHPEYLY
jgi:hypothetical protein